MFIIKSTLEYSFDSEQCNYWSIKLIFQKMYKSKICTSKNWIKHINNY